MDFPLPDAGRPPDALPRPDAAPPPIPQAVDAARPAPDMGAPADTGGAPVDVGPLVAPEVYLIVGAMPLSAADSVLERHLRGLGLRVSPVVDDLLGTVDTARAALIFISATVGVMNIGQRFREAPQPVVVAEPLLYDDMGLVEAIMQMGINRGTQMGETTLRIDRPDSPLAASLMGDVVVASQATQVSWGAPSASAIRVASLFGEPGRVAILAYEAGAAMFGLTAPARRVGFFLSEGTANVLNRDGFALLDATVSWALGR